MSHSCCNGNNLAYDNTILIKSLFTYQSTNYCCCLLCIYIQIYTAQEGNQRSEKASFISVYINSRLLTEVSSYYVTELKPRAFLGRIDTEIYLGLKWCTQQPFLSQKRDIPYAKSCLNDARCNVIEIFIIIEKLFTWI